MSAEDPRRDAARGAPDGGDGVTGALREAWRRSGGWPGLLAGTTPTAVFVVVSILFGLVPAVVAAALAAVAVFTVQIVRGESLAGAVAGLGVAALCAVAATVTGDDRGFFLLPTVTPAVVAVVCAGSVLVRRPVVGLAVNRVAGGPRAWRQQPRLLRIYDVATVLGAVLSAGNFGLRAFFYATDRTALLAVVYAATGPVVVVLAAVTVVAVRRHLGRERRAAA